MTSKIPSREGADSAEAVSSRTAPTNESHSQHTPGPWTAQLGDAPFWVQPPNGDEPVICDLVARDTDVFTEEDEANARLIAAAPRMYERIATLASEGDAEAVAILEAIHGRS